MNPSAPSGVLGFDCRRFDDRTTLEGVDEGSLEWKTVTVIGKPTLDFKIRVPNWNGPKK